MARLPTVGGDNNSWGTVLSDYLQQALNSDGTLMTSATNAYTGSANTNLASASKPGLVQLAGDLAGTAASPTLASVITAGSVGSSAAIPVLTYDAKGRITATGTATPAQAGAATQGTIQLAGDLTGSATAPALASVVTAGSVGAVNTIPVITYDAKGRITATSTTSQPQMALNANFTTSSATQTATNLTFSIAANESWYVEYTGTAGCSGIGGLRYQINTPAGATIEGWVMGTTTTATAFTNVRITAINTPVAATCHNAAAAIGPDRIWFRINNSGTAGSVTLAAASITATQTSTIYAGSSLRALKVTLV